MSISALTSKKVFTNTFGTLKIMLVLFKSLRCHRKYFLHNSPVYFSTNLSLNQLPRPVFRRQVPLIKRIGPYGFFMLLIPAASFSLGVWQIQRKKWKESLIVEMKERTNSAPIELPENLDDLQALEYRPIHVRGTFLHDREIYLGPRSLVEKEEASFFLPAASGYLVITPFKLEDRDLIILINRGWIPSRPRKPSIRPQMEVKGVVDVIGLLRSGESRPVFTTENQSSNIFTYRDLNHMCAATGASPIFLDQTLDFPVEGGPVAGQTRVTLRNEHMSYIITWFALGIATTYMWFRKYVGKFP